MGAALGIVRARGSVDILTGGGDRIVEEHGLRLIPALYVRFTIKPE